MNSLDFIIMLVSIFCIVIVFAIAFTGRRPSIVFNIIYFFSTIYTLVNVMHFTLLQSIVLSIVIPFIAGMISVIAIYVGKRI